MNDIIDSIDTDSSNLDGVVLSYVKLHAEYWSNTFKVIYPSDITSSIHSLSTNNTPKFEKDRQHDAQELLVEIKDMLCDRITGVSELFQGLLEIPFVVLFGLFFF
jgi:hypothetical protein